MLVEQICSERRLFRGSLLGWGTAGTQWGICYFGPSRAIAHKLTSSPCKCLFSAKTLNLVLVLEKVRDDLSIACAALQSLHLFKLAFALETNPKQLEEFSPSQSPHVSWLPSGGATSLLSHARADKRGFKLLCPCLTLLLMITSPCSSWWKTGVHTFKNKSLHLWYLWNPPVDHGKSSP